ncbi:hypothetical protein ES703_71841 [subsurface metagenome]
MKLQKESDKRTLFLDHQLVIPVFFQPRFCLTGGESSTADSQGFKNLLYR